MRNRICGIIAMVLVCLQVLLIVASWIITSAMPDIPMRSLLSAGGIRWFFGNFTSNLDTTLFVDLILLVIAFGSMYSSGLADTIRNIVRRKRLRYFESVAIWVVAIELIISIVVVILLTLVPHAILLSVTGHLFPSSFSHSIIPIISFILLICSLSFGIISSRFNNLEQVYESLVCGLRKCVWIVPIYVFAMELYSSILFVFSI